MALGVLLHHLQHILHEAAVEVHLIFHFLLLRLGHAGTHLVFLGIRLGEPLANLNGAIGHLGTSLQHGTDELLATVVGIKLLVQGLQGRLVVTDPCSQLLSGIPYIQARRFLHVPKLL
ncbi:hypothetical protein D3C80_1488360 [compost metagenome]